MYFFDTYVLVEFINGNESVIHFFKEHKPIITVFNLVELHYAALRLHGKDIAEKSFEQFKNLVVSIPNDVLKEAMEFKLLNKKKKLSYADCIGYVYAKKNNLKFLTGDIQFKEMENVAYIT